MKLNIFLEDAMRSKVSLLTEALNGKTIKEYDKELVDYLCDTWFRPFAEEHINGCINHMQDGMFEPGEGCGYFLPVNIKGRIIGR